MVSRSDGRTMTGSPEITLARPRPSFRSPKRIQQTPASNKGDVQRQVRVPRARSRAHARTRAGYYVLPNRTMYVYDTQEQFIIEQSFKIEMHTRTHARTLVRIHTSNSAYALLTRANTHTQKHTHAHTGARLYKHLNRMIPVVAGEPPIGGAARPSRFGRGVRAFTGSPEESNSCKLS